MESEHKAWTIWGCVIVLVIGIMVTWAIETRHQHMMEEQKTAQVAIENGYVMERVGNYGWHWTKPETP